MSVKQLDTVAVARMNRVCQETGAVIVVSSTWRLGDEKDWAKTKRKLRMAGLKGKIVDRTAASVWIDGERANERGHEIQAWLTEHPEVTSFAIVDDDSDMVHLMDRLVKTTWDRGFEDSHAEQLIALLNG
jgi:hypothetical protein